MLAGRDFLQVEVGPEAHHGILEQRVHVFEFFFQLGPVFVSVPAEHRHGALVFARRDLLEVDPVTVEHAIEIRDLGQHADRPEDRKRCGIDLRPHAGHQVAATGRDLVDTHHERNVAVANARQLRCRQPVLVHDAAMILEPQDDLVVAGGHRQDRADFLA